MTLRVRALREEEGHRLARMTRSQKLGAGLVRRAQIIQHAVDGLSAPGIAAKMGLCDATVRFWLKRFNERGLPGLEEEMRSGGRRPTPPRSAALLSPRRCRGPPSLGLPFASWTLDRLVAYLGEKGIGMKRSRVSEVLLAEGLKWRQEETWFGRGWTRSSSVKGGARAPHTAPPEGSVVVCLDEMGPQSARSYPGRRVVKPAPPKAQRAKQEIDYGRRGKGYVFGAFRPATGEAFTAPYTGRTTANWVDFLGAGRGLDQSRCRAGLRRGGQPHRPQRHRRAALRSGPPALGIRVPAQVRGLPEPDRTVVEDPALFGPQRPPLRDLARDRRSRPARHRVLERAQASFRLGP